MQRLRITAVTFALIALVAAGCDDDKGKGEQPGASGASGKTSTTLAAVVTATTVGTSDCPGEPSDISVLRLGDNVFEPRCLTVNEAQALRVTNAGTRKHNLTFEGISKDLDPQESVNLQPPMIEKIKPGTYEVFCRFHKAQGMTGTIKVVRPG